MSQDGLKRNAAKNHFADGWKANLDFHPAVESSARDQSSESFLEIGQCKQRKLSLNHLLKSFSGTVVFLQMSNAPSALKLNAY